MGAHSPSIIGAATQRHRHAARANLSLPLDSTHYRAPWWSALLGALLGGVVALMVFAPAVWLAHAVAGASDQRLVLAEVNGTLWQGSARLQLTGGALSRDAMALPGRVHWRLAPDGLGLRAALTADCCTPLALQARLGLGWKHLSVDLDDGVSQWPASLLAGLGTPWNTVLLEGQLALSTKGLSLEWAEGRLALKGQAQLDVIEASSRLSTLKPLGSYRLHLSGHDSQGQAPTQLTLETLSGDLRLSGSGQWVGSRLRFNGQASAAPDREAALANLLNIVGRRQGALSIITIG